MFEFLLEAYIDLSPTETDTGTISFTVGDSTSNQWKIKVTNIMGMGNCLSYYVPSPGVAIQL